VLNLVKEKLVEWESFKAGPLPCREFYNAGAFNEEYFAEFREKKLAAILAYDVEKEDKDKWLDYENEESQIKLDLADIILDKLVGEVVDILNDHEEKIEQLKAVNT
jgi:hypothetical protein